MFKSRASTSTAASSSKQMTTSSKKDGGKSKSLAEKFHDQVDDYIDPKYWLGFFIFILAGIFCMSWSLMYLPLLLINPQGFSGWFTCGSICFLSSFAVLRGPTSFVRHFFKRERLPFTICYIGSLLGTIYIAEFMHSQEILSFIFIVLQFVALFYFLLSFIPGGMKFAEFICDKCCGRRAKTEVIIVEKKTADHKDEARRKSA